MDKPYLSPSSLGMYFKCGEQYRRRYICGEIVPPGFALIKGSAVHSAAEENFKQKIKSHEDMSHADIVDIAAAAFEAKYIKDGVLVIDEDGEKSKEVLHGEYLDSTVSSAKSLADNVLPKYQPIATEEKVRLELPESSHDLLGILDLIYEDGIQDLKNTSKKMNQADVDSGLQFTIYSALYRSKYGKMPKEIAVDNIVHKAGAKKAAEYQTILTTRSECDFTALANRMNAAIHGIRSEVFTPASPGSWWCGPKWCGFYHSCPHIAHK